MLKIRVHGLICGGVTSVHFNPPFVVTWMSPSPVPAHSTLTSSGEGANAVTVPRAVRFTSVAYLPAFDGTSHVCRVRSPLIAFQLRPPSNVFHTPEVAAYKIVGSFGDQITG